MRLMTASMFLVIAFANTAAYAQDEGVTGTESEGYTLGENDLWWRGTDAYLREWVEGEWYQAWNRYCCCYRWYQRQGYYRYKKVLSRRSVNFWAELASLKARIEEDRLKAAAIAATFPSQTVAAPSYAAAQSIAGSQTITANTVLPFGSIDVNASNQAYAQTTQSLATAAANAAKDQADLNQQIVESATTLSEQDIRSRALLTITPALTKAVAEALNANQATASVPVTAAATAPGVAPVASYDAFFASVATPLCAQCHGVGKPQVAKFDLASYRTMNLAERRDRVWPHLNYPANPWLTPDVSKRMPKDHPALTKPQFDAFVLAQK